MCEHKFDVSLSWRRIRAGRGCGDIARLVGAAIAKEWILTARKIDAVEAEHHGLVNRLYDQPDLLPAALETARMIAANSESAVRISKEVIDLATLDGDARAREASANKSLRGSEEQTARFKAATKRVTGRE
ncbi:MAG: hypothetical protein KDI19_02540 [Pseudomonadales bacterium]|nr:hypothetical protein [Pseudomonadales bacterium]